MTRADSVQPGTHGVTTGERTSLQHALARLGMELPTVGLYDEEETLLVGHDAGAADALMRHLETDLVFARDAQAVIWMLSRAESYDEAVWIDADQNAVLALLLHQVADDAARAGRLPVSPARPRLLPWLRRLITR